MRTQADAGGMLVNLRRSASRLFTMGLSGPTKSAMASRNADGPSCTQ